MSDTTETTQQATTEESTGPAPETTSTETTEAEQTTEEQSTEEPKPAPEDELPEWARKELTKARGEAANYRTRLREAETRLSEAKTPEEFQAALSEVAEKNAQLERSIMVSNVAREFDLPAELAELLKGEDEAALKTHAQSLAKYAAGPREPESLSGGLTPGDAEEFDPVAEVRKVRARRY